MTVPKGVKMPADHKAPVQAEAEGVEMIDVEWHGHVYAVPADADDWSVEAMMAFESGLNAHGLQAILKPADWKTLMATSPRKRDLMDLFDTMAKALGLDGAPN
ncbi:MAG: hypothetical protein ACOH10_08000 [Rhodoglobus sp.]